jgi:uncharacterized protein
VDALRIADSPGGIVLAVRVLPRSSKSAVAGTRHGALLVRLAAPPVDGAANDALIALLAALFERPKRDVTIVSGHTSRDKRVAVSGVTRDTLVATLSDILRA